MIAKVQYNDIIGTAAADISDFQMNSLQKYLTDTYASYDNDRFYCEGCRIYAGGQSSPIHISIYFICYDKVDNKYVYFCPMADMSVEDVFSLFKRFEVVMGRDNINDVVVKNEDWLDLK